MDIRCSRDGIKCDGCPIMKECEKAELTEEVDLFKIYNQAIEDFKKAILTDKELQFAPYSQEMWFKNRIMDIAERLTK